MILSCLMNSSITSMLVHILMLIKLGKNFRNYLAIMILMAYMIIVISKTPMDRWFEQMPGVVYCRYSDDIVIFSKDKDTLNKAKEILHGFLCEFNLDINTDKEIETQPGESWTFLGFECDGKSFHQAFQ